MKSLFKKVLLRLLFRSTSMSQIERGIDFGINLDKLKELNGIFSTNYGEFLFNAKRLSYSQLKMLFDEIGSRDNYHINLLPPDNAVVVDIGTHLGVLPYILTATTRNCKIYAVEPDRENRELAKINLDKLTAGSSNNISIYDYAIAPNRGNHNFYTSTKVDWRSTLLVDQNFLKNHSIEKDELVSSYRVECITLGDFLNQIEERRIHLLKMTIAGEIEADVIESSLDAIKSKEIDLFALLVYPRNEARVAAALGSVGFQLFSKPRNNSLRVYRRTEPKQ